MTNYQEQYEIEIKKLKCLFDHMRMLKHMRMLRDKRFLLNDV